MPGPGFPDGVTARPGISSGTGPSISAHGWDLGDVESGDVNGDGLDDIVFSIARSNCDSIPGTRPRVWIQNAAHRFIDETATRVPPLSTSTFDTDLFDADGDADLDILLCGYSCRSRTSPATLLINDGTGTFTDETATRILAIPENHILYFAGRPDRFGSLPRHCGDSARPQQARRPRVLSLPFPEYRRRSSLAGP